MPLERIELQSEPGLEVIGGTEESHAVVVVEVRTQGRHGVRPSVRRAPPPAAELYDWPSGAA